MLLPHLVAARARALELARARIVIARRGTGAAHSVLPAAIRLQSRHADRFRGRIATATASASASSVPSTQGTPPDGLDSEEIAGPSVPLPHQPLDVLQPDSHPGAALLLGQDALIVTRQVEMMNIFLGYEQANRYQLLSPSGQPVGYLAEEETGVLGGAIQRQVLRTHRPFKATVLDLQGNAVLRISRPFTFINSHTSIYSLESGGDGDGDGDGTLVGEGQQRWHPWRRKYDLFTKRSNDDDDDDDGGASQSQSHTMDQFATIDTGLLGWDFVLQDEHGGTLGTINRNFRGFGRELFTDTGQYVVRFHPVRDAELHTPQPHRVEGDAHTPGGGLDLVTATPGRPLTLDERAVALCVAVSVDFDYFSRHSHGGAGGGGGMFPWIWMGGGGGGGGAQQEPAPQQDSSDVQEAPPPHAPESDGGLGTAVGTGAAYEWGQQQQWGGGGGGGDDPPATAEEDGWGGQGGPGAGAPQEEEVWGSQEPWTEDGEQQVGSGAGGFFEGWSLGDFLPGGGGGD